MQEGRGYATRLDQTTFMFYMLPSLVKSTITYRGLVALRLTLSVQPGHHSTKTTLSGTEATLPQFILAMQLLEAAEKLGQGDPCPAVCGYSNGNKKRTG